MTADNEKKIIVKTSEEIEVMRQANSIVADVFGNAAKGNAPGPDDPSNGSLGA